MDALEFSTKIEQGTIQLPEKYSDYGNAYVRVIILIDKPEQTLTQKEKLSLTFQKMEIVQLTTEKDGNHHFVQPIFLRK